MHHRLFIIFISVSILLILGLTLGLLIYDPNKEMYDYVRLKSNSALCLDGSIAGYYISRNGDPSKIYLYFESGGWCSGKTEQQTLDSCYDRSQTTLGSAKYQRTGHTFSFSDGILSKNTLNYFRDWKKVYLIYCDGTGHQGTRKDPILHKGKLLYFRGHNITIEQLQNLQQRIGLFSKSLKIVVSGQSAGGLASFMWTNYIAQRAQKAEVRSIPGSGIFLDTFNYLQNDNKLKLNYKSLVNLVNKQIDPPTAQCVAAYPNQKQKCFFAQYNYEFIKVPLMPVQSLYDTWSIPQGLGVVCDQYFETSSFQYCDSTQLERIQKYRQQTRNVMVEMGKKEGNGVWGIACPVHAILILDTVYSGSYQVPESSSNTVDSAIRNWMQNKTSIHIDSAIWPNNKPCSFYY